MRFLHPFHDPKGVKKRILVTIRPFRWGVDLAQVKNRVFLVILNDFGRFSPFWAKPHFANFWSFFAIFTLFVMGVFAF